MDDFTLLRLVKVWAVFMMIGVSVVVLLFAADTAWRVLFK